MYMYHMHCCEKDYLYVGFGPNYTWLKKGNLIWHERTNYFVTNNNKIKTYLYMIIHIYWNETRTYHAWSPRILLKHSFRGMDIAITHALFQMLGLTMPITWFNSIDCVLYRGAMVWPFSRSWAWCPTVEFLWKFSRFIWCICFNMVSV